VLCVSLLVDTFTEFLLMVAMADICLVLMLRLLLHSSCSAESDQLNTLLTLLFIPSYHPHSHWSDVVKLLSHWLVLAQYWNGGFLLDDWEYIWRQMKYPWQNNDWQVATERERGHPRIERLTERRVPRSVANFYIFKFLFGFKNAR